MLRPNTAVARDKDNINSAQFAATRDALDMEVANSDDSHFDESHISLPSAIHLQKAAWSDALDYSTKTTLRA